MPRINKLYPWCAVVGLHRGTYYVSVQSFSKACLPIFPALVLYCYADFMKLAWRVSSDVNGAHVLIETEKYQPQIIAWQLFEYVPVILRNWSLEEK